MEPVKPSGTKRKRETNDGEEKVIMKRRAMTLVQKIAILDRLATGESSTSVARRFGLSEGTVRSVRKCEEKIRTSLAAGAPYNAKTTFYARDTLVQRMEKILIDWIDEQAAKEIPIDGAIIRREAKKLYDDLKAIEESKQDVKPEKPSSFVASKGWYDKFKKRVTQYKSLPEFPSVYMEQFGQENTIAEEYLFPESFDETAAKPDESEVSQLDHDEAQKFPAQLMKIVDMKSYVPEQVFNAAAIGLFWKRMPVTTFLCEEEKENPGLKFSNEYVHLLLCSNVSGDCNVKPLAVYRTLNPRSLKGKNKHQLPVFWKGNSQSKISEVEFMDWFHNCFMHDVKLFLASKKLPFKALLVVDSLPCFPYKLQYEDPNVKVVFLPENTAPLLQPFDQGLLGLFRANYICKMFDRVVHAKSVDNYSSVSEIWWDFNLVDCLKIIKDSLEDIRPTTINACWNNLWPDAVVDLKDIPSVQHVITKIVELGHSIGGPGFLELDTNDIEELLESHNVELTPNELAELIAGTEEEVPDCDVDELKNRLTIETLEKGFKLASELKDLLFSLDPFMERGFESRKGIEDALAPYKEMYDELQYSRSLLINNAVPKKLKSKLARLRRSSNLKKKAQLTPS